jgi:hypothetical protein
VSPRAIAIWCMALVFSLVKNAYFGWHLTPESDAELVCDGMTVLMFCLALLVPREGNHRG